MVHICFVIFWRIVSLLETTKTHKYHNISQKLSFLHPHGNEKDYYTYLASFGRRFIFYWLYSHAFLWVWISCWFTEGYIDMYIVLQTADWGTTLPELLEPQALERVALGVEKIEDHSAQVVDLEDHSVHMLNIPGPLEDPVKYCVFRISYAWRYCIK